MLLSTRLTSCSHQGGIHHPCDILPHYALLQTPVSWSVESSITCELHWTGCCIWISLCFFTVSFLERSHQGDVAIASSVWQLFDQSWFASWQEQAADKTPARKIKHLGLPRISRGRSQSFRDQGDTLHHNFQLFFLDFPVRKPPTRLNDSCSTFDES